VDSSGTLKHRITVATGTVTTVTYIWRITWGPHVKLY
jgi:hypothetical protein